MLNEKKRADIRAVFENKDSLKKFNEEHNTRYSNKKLPKEFRAKLTRAMRRRLTKQQLNAKTLKQKKREANFPQRKFAVVA